MNNIPQATLEVIGEAANTLTDTQLGALLALSLIANAALVWSTIRYYRKALDHRNELIAKLMEGRK